MGTRVMKASSLARGALLVAVMALAAACGRKADLDTPYQAQIDRQEAARDAGEPVPPDPKPVVKERRFFLDGLID